MVDALFLVVLWAAFVSAWASGHHACRVEHGIPAPRSFRPLYRPMAEYGLIVVVCKLFSWMFR